MPSFINEEHVLSVIQTLPNNFDCLSLNVINGRDPL